MGTDKLNSLNLLSKTVNLSSTQKLPPGTMALPPGTCQLKRREKIMMTFVFEGDGNPLDRAESDSEDEYSDEDDTHS